MRAPMILASLLVFAGVAQAAPNLVVNGGFEAQSAPPAGYTLDVTPTGWTGTGDLVGQGYAGSVNSGDGNNWFDLNPDTSAGTGLHQVINGLVAGTAYTFSFEYNGGGGGTTTQIAFDLTNTQGSLFSGTVSTANLNVYGGTPWATYSTTFVAGASLPATLSFNPNGVWSGGFIDKVSITPSVPEPGAAALSLAGLALMATVIRRRIHQA